MITLKEKNHKQKYFDTILFTYTNIHFRYREQIFSWNISIGYKLPFLIILRV